MSKYLDKEVRDRLNERLVLAENIGGKTIVHVVHDINIVAMTFEDGSWCALEGEYDFESADINNANEISPFHLQQLYLITHDEYKLAAQRASEARTEIKRRQIEKLQEEMRREQDLNRIQKML